MDKWSSQQYAIFPRAAPNVCTAVFLFTVRSLQAVMCEDSSHYYLMIYCNSPSLGICFVFRSLLSGSLWLVPVVCFGLKEPVWLTDLSPKR